jgi:pyridoxamine 5'-phosphate oxidase
MDTPFQQFSEWLDTAKATPAIVEPTAMTLATATKTGKPSARIVLLKGFSVDGFVFYTNLTSRKSAELIENPYAALCFYWMPLERQVRIEGCITPVTSAEADAYFASRPRDRQIGAWASLQSQQLHDRKDLEARVAELERQYANTDVPRPPHWSGWRLTPDSFEFWHQNWARLHERHLYMRAGSGWKHTLLYP